MPNYVVCPVNFEYNDEINVEAGLSPPIALFRSKEKAKQFALKKTIEDLKNEDLKDYYYNLDDIIDEEILLRILEVDYIDEYNLDFSNLTDEQFNKIIANMRLKFYEVHELDFKDY